MNRDGGEKEDKTQSPVIGIADYGNDEDGKDFSRGQGAAECPVGRGKKSQPTSKESEQKYEDGGSY